MANEVSNKNNIEFMEVKMKTEVVKKNNVSVAVIHSDEHLITDVQSALDLIMSVKYETGCKILR